MDEKTITHEDTKQNRTHADVVASFAVLAGGWGLTYADFFLNEYIGVHDSVLYALAQAMMFAGFVLTGKAYVDYSILKHLKKK